MAKLKLLGDHVAVQVEEKKELESGILLPGTAKKERPQTGVVKFVGPGTEEKTMELKVGDRVVFAGWTDPITVENEEYYFISQDDIKAVIQ